MYGYVRPSLTRLTEEEKELFQAAYCGLCHTLGRRYGFLSRFILNYDFTFLSILLNPTTGRCKKRCAVAPCRGRCALEGDEPLDLAADCTVILAWWQLQDGVQDSGFLRGLKYRFLRILLQRAYHRAAVQRPVFDRSAREHLSRLSQLEAQQCATLDEPADTFATLLAEVALEVGDPVGQRVLYQFLYHLGRWVYLVDAADDLKKDAEKGSYNPLIYRYGLRDGLWTGEAKAAVGRTLDLSIEQMAAAYELWEFGPWSGIVRSTVYEGLYAVGNAVLEGTFRDRKLRHRHKEQI